MSGAKVMITDGNNHYLNRSPEKVRNIQTDRVEASLKNDEEGHDLLLTLNFMGQC